MEMRARVYHSPVYQLRKKLFVPTQKREHEFVQRNLITMAWNKHVHGETIKALRFTMVGTVLLRRWPTSKASVISKHSL